MKNQKYLKRTVALVLACVMSLSLVACGGSEGKKTGNNGGKEVEIAFWQSGMGIEYLEKMIEAFNSKQSEWNVIYNASAVQKSLTSALGMDDADTVDLYMIGKCYDTEYMEPLDGLLDSTADGDSKTLKEKFNENYLATEKAADGHYYTLANNSGIYSLIYNKKMFEKANITEAPRTTDEVAVACDMLLDAGVTPLAIFGTWGYWDFFVEAWQAQYDGYDYYLNNYHACTDETGQSPSKDIFTRKDGRYQVLKAMEKIITPEYVVPGGSAEDHISMQTIFLNTDVGMMVSGNWMANEMQSVGSMEDFGVMKTPVISAITDKLTTVSDDAELRMLITAIDSVIDGKAKLDDYKSGSNYVVEGKEIAAADWDFVMAARTTSAAGFNSNFIPVYSDAKEGAKEFLKFFYSDEGMKIYSESTHVSLPLAYSDGQTVDTSKWNTFEREADELLNKTNYYAMYTMMNRHPIFRAGGAKSYGEISAPVFFSTRNAKDRMTADDVWEAMLATVEKKYEKDWLVNIR